MKSSDIWVWVETVNGIPCDASVELLNPGRLLADALGAALTGVITGHNIKNAEEAISSRGADKIISVDHIALSAYNAETCNYVMCLLAHTYQPNAILIGGTLAGRELAPLMACRLNTGLTADCTGLEADVLTGNIQWTRPAFGGNLMAVIECPAHRPQIGTVRPGVFQKPVFVPGRTAEIVREIVIDLPAPRARLIDFTAYTGLESRRLEKASVIIAGGLGLGKPENFKLLYELADVMGGSVAASRSAVDAGWISSEHQVGQTGKNVHPKIYIACGISGAVQHLAGISGAETVIAINKDPRAPVFGAADYGVVGDLAEVIPVLTAELGRVR